ncbi:MAG: endolytic transglycosylase MltG [Prevotellaceae bacterium]|nr:endolytic transglycosylase MltG [Prevotellaceae bacterium]
MKIIPSTSFFKNRRVVLPVVLVFLLTAAFVSGYRYYYTNYASNVSLPDKAVYLYVRPGADFNEVLDSLRSLRVLKDERTFISVAVHKNYSDNIHTGRYKLTDGMNNKQLVHALILGEQEPVRLTLSGNIRTNRRLAALLSRYIQPDSLAILQALNDTQRTAAYGFTPATIMGMFIPNTYEVYWNISVDGLLQRMKREYDAFWNAERREKAAAVQMTPQEVVTLASIVCEESLKADEMPRIAGVYVNRLRKGIPLQADPTLKYAAGNFALRRVLTRHIAIDSPYNTYKYAGLPPGPICVPPPVAIDAVLNYETHQYLYFCAKADFSGYHSFSKTLAQHNQYAREYQQALSRNRIYR